jgi:hypothetical protein
MAFDPKPSTWLPSWSENGTDITLPIASIPELTAAEADATTGDIRKVVFALLTKLYAVWSALDSADRPTKMQLQKRSNINTDTGIITHTFSATFECSVSAQDVTAEPS